MFGSWSAAAPSPPARVGCSQCRSIAGAGTAFYELAGDDSYTLTEFAAEIASQSGKAVTCVHMPRANDKAALPGFGLPEPIADQRADSDIGASNGALFDEGRALSALIGQPTTPMREAVAAAINA